MRQASADLGLEPFHSEEMPLGQIGSPLSDRGDTYNRSREMLLSSTTRTRAFIVESTVPMEDFNSIAPVPTVTVGLLRPSEVGEEDLGESGVGV